MAKFSNAPSSNKRATGGPKGIPGMPAMSKSVRSVKQASSIGTPTKVASPGVPAKGQYAKKGSASKMGAIAGIGAGRTRTNAGKNKLVKSAFAALLVMLCAISASQAAITCTSGGVKNFANGQSYTVITLAGSLESSAVATCTAAITKATVGGGVQVNVTANGTTGIITARVFDSGLHGATVLGTDPLTTGLLFSKASAAGVSGRQALTGALFEELTATAVNSWFVLPPTTVTIDILNGEADAANVVTGKVIFMHAP